MRKMCEEQSCDKILKKDKWTVIGLSSLLVTEGWFLLYLLVIKSCSEHKGEFYKENVP